MSEVIDIRRGPAAFPCGSWWANATLALPAVVFFAECCPLRWRASSTGGEAAAIVPGDPGEGAAAAPAGFLIELVETWTTTRIRRVDADGTCEVVCEGEKRRGPWKAIAFCDGEPPGPTADVVRDDERDALIANAKAPPTAPARAEGAPQP